VLEYKLASTLSSAALPQAALADFLSSGGSDSHLRRIRRTFAGNIDQMTRVIAQLPARNQGEPPVGRICPLGRTATAR